MALAPTSGGAGSPRSSTSFVTSIHPLAATRPQPDRPVGRFISRTARMRSATGPRQPRSTTPTAAQRVPGRTHPLEPTHAGCWVQARWPTYSPLIRCPSNRCRFTPGGWGPSLGYYIKSRQRPGVLLVAIDCLSPWGAISSSTWIHRRLPQEVYLDTKVSRTCLLRFALVPRRLKSITVEIHDPPRPSVLPGCGHDEDRLGVGPLPPGHGTSRAIDRGPAIDQPALLAANNRTRIRQEMVAAWAECGQLKAMGLRPASTHLNEATVRSPPWKRSASE